MEHKIEIEERIQKRTIVDYYICDICKEEINNNRDGYWRYSEVQMKLCVTTEGDPSSEEFDICESCWNKHIIPFFLTFNAKPREVY